MYLTPSIYAIICIILTLISKQLINVSLSIQILIKNYVFPTIELQDKGI